MIVKKLKRFDVTARMVLLASITIEAESLEDAVQQSKELKEVDFVKFKDQFVDGSITIGSVSKSDYFDTEQER
jgi:hypothetical protein